MLDTYDELLTIEELCEVLQIGRNYRLPAVKPLALCQTFRIGRRWKIPKNSVQEVLQTKRAFPAP